MDRPNLKTVPLSPGVYLFKNNTNKAIYVGRAGVLKKRVTSYFAKNLADPRIVQMVSEAKRLDCKKTATLLDAVILEASLIKKYWPKYNIREKDNRSFIFIVVPKKEWPTRNASPVRKASLSDAGGRSDAGWVYPIVIRGQQLNKFKPREVRIFGPFKSYSLVKNLLLILRKIFPYSTCKLNQKRPCFYYQIGLCPGKCAGTISARDHQANINNLLLFLSGQRKKVEKILKKTAPQKLNLLKHIDDSMLITGAGQNEYAGIERIEGYDISHFSGKETVGAMVVCENDDFDKSQYRLFKVKSAKPNDDLAALRETITRRLKHKEWPYPDLIMVDGGKAQVRTIEKILVQNSLNIPVVGIAKSPRSVIPAKLVLDCDRGAEIHGNQINIDSRFRGNDRYSDRLIFGRIQKSLKDLISIFFPQLLKIRNEAHRFANSLRKKMLEQSLKNNRRSQSAAKIRYFS